MWNTSRERLFYMRQSIQVDHIPFKFLKGCLPQTLLGPLLNTLSHITLFSPPRHRTYIERTHDVHDVFISFYICSHCVTCPGGLSHFTDIIRFLPNIFSRIKRQYGTICTIWYYFYNLNCTKWGIINHKFS